PADGLGSCVPGQPFGEGRLDGRAQVEELLDERVVLGEPGPQGLFLLLADVGAGAGPDLDVPDGGEDAQGLPQRTPADPELFAEDAFGGQPAARRKVAGVDPRPQPVDGRAPDLLGVHGLILSARGTAARNCQWWLPRSPHDSSIQGPRSGCG